MAAPFPADVKFALHEIGSKEDFTRPGARKAAEDFVGALAALPHAEHMIVVGGYDRDPRELWDIPEARAFVREFAGWVALLLPGRALQDWKLEPASIALVALCTGIGKIIGRDPVTRNWNVEIGRKDSAS